MLCKDIMKRNVETLRPQDSAQSAAKKMRDANVGFLPICDPSQRVLGTLTDRDIAIRLVADGRPAATSVSELMMPELVACRPDDDLRKAQDLMGSHRKSRIVITDDAGKLQGVISLSDVAEKEQDGSAAETMRQVSERETRKY